MSDSEGFSVFLAEKTHLLRRLKPFASADDAALSRILERAWKKFNDQEKDYYVKSEKGLLADVVTLLPENKKEAKDRRMKGRAIYFKEMRLIVLQDFKFVKNLIITMPKMLRRGWIEFNKEQKLAFIAKADYYAKNSSNATSKKSDVKQLLAKLDTVVSRKAYWDNHSCEPITNEFDCLAFCEYANVIQSASDILITPDDMWKQWTLLSEEQQDEYYQKVPELYASLKAEEAFFKRNMTVKSGHKRYNEQHHTLLTAWNDMCDEARQFYAGRSHQKRLHYDKDLKNRFFDAYVDRSFVPNVTTIDDINSKLTPIPLFCNIHNNSEKSAITIFLEKKRPEMLNDPEMAKKRYYVVNNMLLNQWKMEMSQEDKQKYYDIAGQYLEIKSQLSAWHITAADVYTHDMRIRLNCPHYSVFMASWNGVDAVQKQKYAQMAIENRYVLLKKYPYLYESYAWTRCDDYLMNVKEPAAKSTPKSAVDTELEEAIQQLDNTLSTSEKNNIFRSDCIFYSNTIDREAFSLYYRNLAKMSLAYLDINVWWRQFIRLSDEERAVYYNEVLKKEARKLFAQDRCTVTKTSENGAQYAEHMHLLYQKWDNLGAIAQKFYLDIAEKNQHENHKTDVCGDVTATSPYLKTEDVINEPNAYLCSKYPHKTPHARMCDDQLARLIYMRKELPQLWNEPVMADKRYFQLKLILGLRFMKLNDEERKPIVDLVQRIRQIWKDSREFPVNHDIGNEEKVVCAKEVKQNRIKLLKRFPDVNEHFQWILPANQEVTKSTEVPKTNDKTVKDCDEEIHNDASPKTETSETQEIDVEAKAKRVDFNNGAVSNVQTFEKPEIPATNKTAELKLKEPSDTWEFVGGTNDSNEDPARKGDDAEADNLSKNSDEMPAEVVQAKKQPKPYMFYNIFSFWNGTTNVE